MLLGPVDIFTPVIMNLNNAATWSNRFEECGWQIVQASKSLPLFSVAMLPHVQIVDGRICNSRKIPLKPNFPHSLYKSV